MRLSASGREILDPCDARRSALELAAELERRHHDAYTFLAEMERLGVLERVETA